MYDTAQHLRTAGQDLDDLDRVIYLICPTL